MAGARSKGGSTLSVMVRFGESFRRSRPSSEEPEWVDTGPGFLPDDRAVLNESTR
jgi:hypothetical protein